MVAYGNTGSENGMCPRCGKSADKHGVTLMRVTRRLADVVGRLSSPGHMLGALRATTSTGLVKQYVACSGRNDPVGVPAGWTAVPLDPPAGQFNDIYGREFAMPAGIVGANKGCAAIKLLHHLGEEYRRIGATYRYVGIDLYEEADRSRPAPRVDAHGREHPGPKDLQPWRGQGTMGEADEYAAHSCDACRSRVPLFLCDGAIA